MDYAALFQTLYPGFFDQKNIRAMDPEDVCEELVLDLRAPAPALSPLSCPENIRFAVYTGDMEALRALVARVDESWPPFFEDDSRVFCALDGEKPVSFCLLEGMGEGQGLRVGGPGCVGTDPDHRGRGIGLAMVQRATDILRREGYDLSWIHYTHIGPWYQKLGYVPVVRWNREGILPQP